MAGDPGDDSMRTQISKVLGAYRTVLAGQAAQTPALRREKGWSSLMASPGAQKELALGVFTLRDGSIMVTGAAPVADGKGLRLSKTGTMDDVVVWTAFDLAQEEGLTFTSTAFTAVTQAGAAALVWDETNSDPPGSLRAFSTLISVLRHASRAA